MKPFCLPSLLILQSLITLANSQSTTANESPSNSNPTIAIETAAFDFSSELRRETISGLPTAEQLQRLSPFLSPELVSIFQRAKTLQQEQIRRHPYDKPYWIEGDLFSSLFEGVTSWQLGEAFHAPTADATVKVTQSYSKPNLNPVTWTDTLVFKMRGENWLLDDIRMGGDWAFKSGRSFRSQLPGGGHEHADHLSLDERWRVKFTREDDAVTGITIQPADESTKPINLFGDDSQPSCTMPTWVVWSPNQDLIALRLGDSPRFARTLLFRLEGTSWKAVPLPDLYPEQKQTMIDHGFKERDCLIDADHWEDAETLVVKYFGSFTKEDEGDGFYKFIKLRIDKSGKVLFDGAVDVPGEE